VTERFDAEDRDWPQRPWIMAAIGAAAGLAIFFLTDRSGDYSTPFPVWRQVATAFTIVAAVSFLLTVELRRWVWAVAFAIGWGAVIALVGWFTAQYNQVPEIFEAPFFSGILAVLIAAPLFQTVRDEGAWRFPYQRLHRHAWTDAVIGAASLAFTGVTFLLCWLIAMLFSVIGIDAIKELLEEEWFAWSLAGFAFGAAIGILRERDGLVATLQKLVMVIFSVLAPVLAVALAAFLLSLPFTGLSGLWESDIPATPMLLLSGAGAILLANAVIGNGQEDRSPSIWLRRAALLLVVCILPLAFFAALSMGQRIGQYGWTPERIWGSIAVAIALAYGASAWWAVFKGGQDFDDPLRPLQTKLAIGLCGLALFLALPLVDFGAISANSQLARLHNGKVKAEEFDWRALAFDFGPEGRERLAELAKHGAANVRDLAKTALNAEYRYDIDVVEDTKTEQQLDRYLRKIPADLVVTPALRAAIVNSGYCSERSCAIVRITDGHMVIAGQRYESMPLATEDLRLRNGAWESSSEPSAVGTQKQADLAKATIELRTVERKQLYVDGKPVGEDME
jgi:hypothetical protein